MHGLGKVRFTFFCLEMKIKKPKKFFFFFPFKEPCPLNLFIFVGY